MTDIVSRLRDLAVIVAMDNIARGLEIDEGTDEIERLRKDGLFLLDRLDGFEREIQDDNLIREWSGHVMPAIARFRAAINIHKHGEKNG